MNIISLKEYARQHNISYEAVRKQVKRYSKDLAGHIVKDGRQQLLDEDAVAFLDSKREKNPVVIFNQDKDDTIKALEAENKSLLHRVVLLQEQLAEQKLLTAGKEEAEKRAAEAESALTDVRERAAEAERQAVDARKKNVELEVAIERSKIEKEAAERNASEAESALSDVRERLQTAENIATINEQEADRAKAEAEDLRDRVAELEAYKALPWYKKLFKKE